MSKTWKITTIEAGEAVASIEGVNSENAAQAIMAAMYGADPLAKVRAAAAQEQGTERVEAVAA